MLFGLYHHPVMHGRPRLWMLVSQLENVHSYLVLDTRKGGGASVLACTDGLLNPARKCTHDPPPVPHSFLPSWMQYWFGYLTSATLENVIRVTPCQTGPQGALSIIGLLLEYTDGTFSCVGQYRDDGIMQTLDVKDVLVLCIGLGAAEIPSTIYLWCLWMVPAAMHIPGLSCLGVARSTGGLAQASS